MRAHHLRRIAAAALLVLGLLAMSGPAAATSAGDSPSLSDGAQMASGAVQGRKWG